MKRLHVRLSFAALGSALWWFTERLLDTGVAHLMEMALRIIHGASI